VRLPRQAAVVVDARKLQTHRIYESDNTSCLGIIWMCYV
jgi:hypothetical protein